MHQVLFLTMRLTKATHLQLNIFFLNEYDNNVLYQTKLRNTLEKDSTLTCTNKQQSSHKQSNCDNALLSALFFFSNMPYMLYIRLFECDFSGDVIIFTKIIQIFQIAAFRIITN